MVRSRAALTAALAAALLVQPTLAIAEGSVDIQLEMGGLTHQTYDCIFVGTVVANGKPMPGAHIAAYLTGSHGQDVTEITDADAQGHFQLHLALDGKPQDETTWKLTAKAPVMGADESAVEGRVILPEESNVMIDRSIQLTTTGA